MASSPKAAKHKTSGSGKATAQSMVLKQREISISEFFIRNRHLLSLDACEEAGILPQLLVEIESAVQDRYIMRVQDNGPGIVKTQIPNIFGKLLYGSKFHRLCMSRGQQRIDISAASMYGQLTTGKPTRIISRISARRPAHQAFAVHDLNHVIDTYLPEKLESAGECWGGLP